MRRSVLIAAAALAVLAIGIGGGAVMAQESDSEDGSTIKGFVSRVAEILGLEEHTVQDAFTQARQEMMDESIENNLAAMVESGKLTQEQADEIQEWYDAPNWVVVCPPEDADRHGREWQTHSGASRRNPGVVRRKA